MSFETPAIRFTQKSITMYLVALPMHELDLICKIDHWNPQRTGKWKGYQRGLVKSKIHSLARYLERKNGILPVTGFLNVREKGKLSFKGRISRRATQGLLRIPDDTPLWVVDMQHRLEGLREAHEDGGIDGNFSMPVLITEGLKNIDEATQFYVINTQSKKMGVDLTRRLMIEHDRIRDLSNVSEWEIKAVQIAIKLNRKRTNNPWYQKIRAPESARLETHIATEKSFVPSLKWLLTARGIKGRSKSRLTSFLSALWYGLAQALPDAFSGGRSYLIQKTPGFMAIHKLAPIIYRKAKGSTKLRTYVELFKKLQKSKRFNSRFWHRKNLRGAKRYGTGQGAYALIASDLQKELRL